LTDYGQGFWFTDLTVRSGHPAAIVSNYGGFSDNMDVADFIIEWFAKNADDFTHEIRSDESLLVYYAMA